MSSMRQLGSGLLYALISVVLVVGGLSLALAEGGFNVPQPFGPSTTPPVPSAIVTETVTPSPVASLGPSATAQVVMATPTFTPIVVPALPTLTLQPSATFRPLPTATRRIYPTSVPCGPYYGWIRSYTVQPGDTLFHISTLYRTTVTALQVANCKNTFTIFPGELLWVPNVPTSTPGITLIPTFPTSTPYPTEAPTLTPFPTDTAIPTLTNTPITPPP